MTGGPALPVLTVLGLESSCDDTAAALVRARVEDGAAHGPGEILSSKVLGQADLHAAFGGVVPEIAARAHAERLDLCVEAALAEAGLGLEAVDLIACTAGPGLIGGVLSGVMCAKGLALGLGKPLVGVNHLEGHALTPRLVSGQGYPYAMLLASGGHCQILGVAGPGDYRRLGATIDDAPGEAFDKVAKMLGLGYPGGPEVEREAAKGDPARFRFPRPLLDKPGCDMSFSGLKTAVRRQRDLLVEAQGGLTPQDRADICAGFQVAVADLLAGKTRRALADFQGATGAKSLSVAGGVAANAALRAALQAAAAAEGFGFDAPPMALCTDNAAMIAWAGAEQFARSGADGMDLSARPRWPLDRKAGGMLGGGKKGPKA